MTVVIYDTKGNVVVDSEHVQCVYEDKDSNGREYITVDIRKSDCPPNYSTVSCYKDEISYFNTRIKNGEKL